MSSALAISGVTAVLQYSLNSIYNPGAGLGSVTVSAIAPDLVPTDVGGNGSDTLQVNLFLHQVTPNQGWRNVGLPSLAADGTTQLKNPPLALDLHYLLTAYASLDFQAEALLGFAVLTLHQNPVLPRAQIRNALSNLATELPTNPLSSALKNSGLADQIEMIKITPATLGREEMAWLWTALKADYRPTFPFLVSVVLIEPQAPSSSGLPVLTRSVSAQAVPTSQFATLLEVQLAPGQSAPATGASVTVTGSGLVAGSQLSLSNQRLGINNPPFAPTAVTSTSITFTVPNLPAGLYSLSVLFTGPGGDTQTTNSLPMGIAPQINLPATVVTNAGKLVTINFQPQALPNQSVYLALGETMVPAQSFTAPTGSLSFQFPAISGSFLARLRVDGVDSGLGINWTVNPPAFTSPFVTV